MYSKLLNLDPEKQDRIINAALKEFTQKGYNTASTNEIVKEANISKGLLFHYFKNKKQLFLFLYDYCVELTTDEIYGKIDTNEKDFFAILKQSISLKMDLLKKYPQIFKFAEMLHMDKSSEIYEELDLKKQEILADAYKILFKNIDMTKFREDFDLKRVINIISWTFEGFANTELRKAALSDNKHIAYDKGFPEAEIYIDMLKKCFYK
jgi:TetR/AcrR family transcriptional regulator